MTKNTGLKSTGRKPRKDLFPEIRKSLGLYLRKTRLAENYSLDDIEFISELTKSVIWRVEEGLAYDIDQYIEYASVLGKTFHTLFKEAMISYPVGPRLALSPERMARVGLTTKIKELVTEEKLFEIETTVEHISTLLTQKKRVEKTKKLSSSISTVLTNWVDDGILTSRKSGNINHYKFK